MIRKILFPILAAATFCAAIPLKVGESWVWRVWDRDSTTSTFKIARVLESAPIAQGTVWLVLGRDSLTQHQDTAKILERKNGRQSWLRASKNLAFELMPYSASDSDTVVVLGADTSYQWGQVSSFPELKASSRYQDSDGKLVSTSKVTSPWIFQGDLTFQYQYSQLPLPKGSWSQEHGLERFVAWPVPTAGIEWRLLSHNDNPIEVTKPAVRIPRVGTKFNWSGSTTKSFSIWRCIGAHGCEINDNSTSDSGSYSWQVRSILADSSDWKRIEVFEESILNQTPNTLTVKRVEVSVRIHATTGQDFQSSLASFPFQKNWVEKWDDSIAGAAEHIQSLYSKSPSVIQRRFFRNADTLHASKTLSSYDIASTQDILTSTFRLMSKEVPPEDTATISIRSCSRAATLSFPDLVQQHPNLSVRWIRPNGQQGMVTASTLVSASFPHRRQVLRLEARLPDGQIWSNSQVMP